MGMTMGAPAQIVPSKLEAVINWGRKNSLWPFPFATACCGIEFMSTLSSQ